jgi:uncharacterized protein YgbK (DUF1537 family)
MIEQTRLVIVADDLTGAADSAARCYGAGLPASVVLSTPHALPLGSVACSSDSRHLRPEDASQQIHTLLAQLSPLSTANTIWYKKIDSTLRGNLGSELDAMLDGLDALCAIICPSFPGQKRGLEHGRLVAPISPAHGSDLPSLLASQSNKQVGLVELEQVQAGEQALATVLAERYAAGDRLIVVDALSEQDLDCLCAAQALALPKALLCGSAGLVGALARRLAPSFALPAQSYQPLAGSALVLVGSGSSMAHTQIEAAKAHCQSYALDQFSTAESTSDLSGDLLLHLAAPPAGLALDGPEARAEAEKLADLALRVFEAQQPELLLLVGGDTSQAVLGRLGLMQLDVVREIQPGMPLATARRADGCSLQIIMKAGNHGEPSSLVDLLAAVRQNNASALPH